MKTDDKVRCAGEGESVFKIAEVDEMHDRAWLFHENGVAHGWEPLYKLFPAEEPKVTVTVLYHVESHPDRHATVVGVFVGDENSPKIKTAIEKALTYNKTWHEYEFHTVERVLDSMEPWAF